MTNQICYVVDDPKLIALIEEIKDGAKPITELQKRLKRQSLAKAMTKMQIVGLIIKNQIMNYMEAPLQKEWECVMTCFGLHNGRQKALFTLNNMIQVERHGHNIMILKIDTDLLEGNNANNFQPDPLPVY
ncbi:hypothetical protein ACFL43_04125 [Thermodesulfobacteriota bacterium]